MRNKCYIYTYIHTPTLRHGLFDPDILRSSENSHCSWGKEFPHINLCTNPGGLFWAQNYAEKLTSAIAVTLLYLLFSYGISKRSQQRDPNLVRPFHLSESSMSFSIWKSKIYWGREASLATMFTETVNQWLIFFLYSSSNINYSSFSVCALPLV